MGILSQEQVTLLTDYDANSAYSAAYHTLYANIRFNWDSERIKQHTILLTTPTLYAGQTAVAANAAIAAAQSGTPTVIVDADLHTPSLQQRFGVGENAGLSDLLVGNEAITPPALAARLCKTFIPGLRLLCAGTASAKHTDLLPYTVRLQTAIASLRQFLAETEDEPSIVIFHSPAVLAGPDAAQLSTLVEQTFLTIVAARTTRRQARQAQEQLERAHAKLAGLIMLDV